MTRRKNQPIDEPPAGDRDSERALVAAVLLDPGLAAAAATVVQASDFTDPLCAAAFGSIIELSHEAKPFDVPAVYGRMKQQADGTNLVAELMGLVQGAGSAASWRYHAERVRDRGMRRRLWAIAYDTLAETHNGRPTAETLASLTGEIAGLNKSADVATDSGFSAAELLTMEMPEVRQVVSGVIPEGLTVLAGAPKFGKSWMLVGGFAVPVACGSMAMGTLDVDPGPVLALCLEDTPRRLKSRMQKILGGETPPGMKLLRFETQWPIIREGGVDKIDRWLGDNPGARLVLIDTLSKIRGNINSRSDRYAEDYAALSCLKQVADSRSVAIVCAHHTRQGIVGDRLEEVNGTSGITGCADAVIVCRRQRGQSDGEIYVTGRDLPEQEFALRFDGITGLWHVLGDAAEFRRTKESMEVIDVLADAGKPMKPYDVATILDAPKDAIRARMSRMAKRGEIQSCDKGMYLPVTPVTPA
jgi:AAA domain/DnaB-like helicase N terminal domain